MPRHTTVFAIVTLALMLVGCAEINKPIRPGDPWKERAIQNSQDIMR